MSFSKSQRHRITIMTYTAVQLSWGSSSCWYTLQLP